jgi:hypothetical protein
MSAVFFRGLVVDVITSQKGSITKKPLEYYKSLVNINVAGFKQLPNNTAIVKIISNALSKDSDSEIVCYPFFSSHLSMPLKPGEQVWIVFEDPTSISQVGYWISRIHEPAHVEDLNYTFFQRARYSDASGLTSAATRDQPTQTFSSVSVTSDPDELVKAKNYASLTHRFEVVPNYVKRPGDLVIQGSHNSLIMLGEARGQSTLSDDNIIKNVNNLQVPAGSGAIDIVVGRGSLPSTRPDTLVDEEMSLTIADRRERTQKESEGAVNFATDSARVYMVSNSRSDEFVNPDLLLNVALPNDAFFSISGDNRAGSFIVSKADQQRMIARSTGTVRIVKEQSSSESGAAMIMHENGIVQIAGSYIALSGFNATGGKGIANQPYIRYTELEALLAELIGAVQGFCTALQSHTTPGYGLPSPEILTAASNLSNSFETAKTHIQNIKSTTIFGE